MRFRVRVYATKEVVAIVELDAKDGPAAMAEARKRFERTLKSGDVGDIEGCVGTEDRGWTLANSRKPGRDGPSVEPIDEPEQGGGE